MCAQLGQEVQIFQLPSALADHLRLLIALGHQARQHAVSAALYAKRGCDLLRAVHVQRSQYSLKTVRLACDAVTFFAQIVVPDGQTVPLCAQPDQDAALVKIIDATQTDREVSLQLLVDSRQRVYVEVGIARLFFSKFLAVPLGLLKCLFIKSLVNVAPVDTLRNEV